MRGNRNKMHPSRWWVTSRWLQDRIQRLPRSCSKYHRTKLTSLALRYLPWTPSISTVRVSQPKRTSTRLLESLCPDHLRSWRPLDIHQIMAKVLRYLFPKTLANFKCRAMRKNTNKTSTPCLQRMKLQASHQRASKEATYRMEPLLTQCKTQNRVNQILAQIFRNIIEESDP